MNMMKITPTLTLDLIKLHIAYCKAVKTPLELFLIQREGNDRVGYSIAYKDRLNGFEEVFCTNYIWSNRIKAFLKLAELVQDEPTAVILVK